MDRSATPVALSLLILLSLPQEAHAGRTIHWIADLLDTDASILAQVQGLDLWIWLLELFGL